MKKGPRKTDAHADRDRPRTVILVADNDRYTGSLRGIWSQLHLQDGLDVVSDRRKAVEKIAQARANPDAPDVAAVILEPETTGEETGQFLREIRGAVPERHVPVVFWTRDGKKYDVLEGNGVDSVLQKPRVLRLIHALDSACQLRVGKPISDQNPMPGGPNPGA